MRRQQRTAQRHHLGQVGIEPLVCAPVQPLEMLREPATQVGTQGLGVLRKKGVPRILDGTGTPQHLEHRGQIVQQRRHIGT